MGSMLAGIDRGERVKCVSGLGHVRLNITFVFHPQVLDFVVFGV